jgi:diguanylate cyclase (GGDEF)-like protein
VTLGSLVSTVRAFRRRRDPAGVQPPALVDDLTGLPNRRALYAGIEQALSDREPDVVVGLALLDLHRFKEVNDTLGHHAGDQLLQLVSERLRGALNAYPGVMLARLGSDEFAVLAPGASGAAEVSAVADHLREALRDPLQLADSVALHVRFSTGVAVAPQHAHSRMDLMRCADLAMNAAKATGAGLPRIYHRDLSRHTQDSQDSLMMAEDLHRALDNHELTLEYEPQVDLQGAVRGAEALVRWVRPDHGQVSPGVFLPIAENHRLMPEVTQAVLGMAIRDGAAWRRAGHDLTVSVNLSGIDLRNAALPRLVRDLLDEHGLPAEALVLEITDTNVMGNSELSRSTLELLRDLGVTLSLGDYGSGHCPLAYLRRMPVQELKLDVAFLPDVATEPRDQAIMRSAVALAHSLGMRLVAEGVEDAVAARVLAEAGCDLAQGWHYARPMTLKDLVTWLRLRNHDNVRHLRPA